MRRVHVLSVLAVGALTVLVVSGLRDVGDDGPEQAIYALAHAVEHDNAGAACDRLVAPREVPAEIRARLALVPPPPRPGSCSSRFAAAGRFEARGFENVLVDAVRPVPIEDRRAGISDAAIADVRLESGRLERVVLVRQGSRWKIVR